MHKASKFRWKRTNVSTKSHKKCAKLKNFDTNVPMRAKKSTKCKETRKVDGFCWKRTNASINSKKKTCIVDGQKIKETCKADNFLADATIWT